MCNFLRCDYKSEYIIVRDVLINQDNLKPQGVCKYHWKVLNIFNAAVKLEVRDEPVSDSVLPR